MAVGAPGTGPGCVCGDAPECPLSLVCLLAPCSISVVAREGQQLLCKGPNFSVHPCLKDTVKVFFSF